MELKPISFSGGLKSISDDDLCATCRNCQYHPGEMSGCGKDWPGLEEENGYVQQCVQFECIADAAKNWTSEPVCCPYCGSKEFVVLDGNAWKAASEEGRSFFI